MKRVILTMVLMLFIMSGVSAQTESLHNFSFNNGKTEISTYQYVEKDDVVFQRTYTVEELNGQEVWHVVNSPTAHKGDTFEYWRDYQSLRLLEMNQTKQYRNIHWQFSGLKAVVSGTDRGKSVNRTYTFPKNFAFDFYDIMRRFDFEHKKQVAFTMILVETNPAGAQRQSFTFINEGVESITIGIGTFKCYKLRLTLSGLLTFFYNGYFWIETAPQRRLIKGKQRQGTFELVDYQLEEKQ